jgi:hypothetical protein
MDSFLSLLKYRQTPVSTNHFSHWALLYHGEKSDMMCHITQGNDSTRAIFEYFPFKESHSVKIIEKVIVGKTTLKRGEFLDLCENMAYNYKFDSVEHNCQNWVKEVLAKLQFEPPSNETCGCVYFLRLSSSTENLFFPTKQSS